MKLPETLARINRELHRRHLAGRSTDISDLDWKPMMDDNAGMFSRYTLHFVDGDSLAFDSMEMSPEMRKALQERAMQ